MVERLFIAPCEAAYGKHVAYARNKVWPGAQASIDVLLLSLSYLLMGLDRLNVNAHCIESHFHALYLAI